MAKQVQQAGSILGKVGQRLRQAHESHKNDETEYSKFGELPGGIEGGIAHLVEAKFGIFKEGKNQGEPFFYAAGTVVSPTEFTNKDGVTYQIEGLRTAIGPIPICDTKNNKGEVTTLDEHVARLYNELRKLGVNTAKLPFEQLEPVVARLGKAGIHFKFRTWQGKPTEQYPDPRVNHDWQGVVKFAPSGNGQQGTMKDEGAPQLPTQAAGGPKAPPTQTKGNGAAPPKGPPTKATTKAAPAPEPEPEPQEETTFDEFGDLESLVKRAEADDGEAQEELSQLAAKVGKGEEATKAQSWQEVADLIQGAQGGDEAGGDDGEAGDAPWKPAPGEIYGYTPPGTKTTLNVEVVEVDEAAETVKLRNPKNKKQTWPKVSWADLESGI